MWFKSNTKKQAAITAAEKLSSIQSNGINLSIDELIPYQSQCALIHSGTRKSLRSKMSGNYLARAKGRGMEFDEVRHYQTGDDIRAIDWRVTARTGETHTKLFKEEVECPVLIATDLTHTMHFGSQLLFKSVQGAHLASLLAWHARNKGDRVGGVVFNNTQHQELKPRSRQQGVLHYLHSLVDIHTSALNTQNIDTEESKHLASQAFMQNCARLRQLAKPGSLVYLITDGYHITREALRHLSNITQHCELVIALISDPLELALPDSKQKCNVTLSDGKNQQTLTLGDKNTAVTYANQMQAFRQQQEDNLTKAGARIIHYSAAELLSTQLKTGISSWIR